MKTSRYVIHILSSNYAMINYHLYIIYFRAKVTDPISVPLSSGDVLFTPPPPSSGALVVNILNILSGYNFSSESINGSENKILTYHRIIEAFKYAYAARTRLGDLDFLDLEDVNGSFLYF